MKINSTDYVLSDKFYIAEKHSKNQILLMDTHHSGMRHFDEWLVRNPFTYHKTTPFTISVGGEVFKHYDPEYQSKVFGIDNIDSRIVPISLENMGWVEYNKKKKSFINWCGDIYETEEDVYTKKWREQLFWASYTQQQLDSLIQLVIELCGGLGIKCKVKDNNVFDDYAEGYRGILYRSNYSKFSTDINPSMDFNYLKEKIEEL